MAQALMKRAIGGIPIVTFIQKESPGMNKLYAQSMCSVSQWRAYQNAEAVVSTEVDEVRSEADEIEPGWSQVRQSFGIHAFSHIYIYFLFFKGVKFHLSLIFLSYNCLDFISGHMETSHAISQHAETKARNGGKGPSGNRC